MQKDFITFHIVRDIPWSNLNRDDTGTPKRTILGGVERGLLSSQSIKRAIRKDYESRILTELPEDASVSLPHSAGRAALGGTLRTRNVVEYTTERAREIMDPQGLASAFDEKKAEKYATSVVKKLFGDGKDVLSFFSVEELETLSHQIASHLAAGTDPDDTELIEKIMPLRRATGALAIAAFGRMFAKSPELRTEAAVAVSPAISAHENLIETDYWIGAEDFPIGKEGAGAAHIGTSLYTSGIFVYSVTIDVKELHTNWTGFSGPNAELCVGQMVRSVIRSLPTGKKNSTAPYTEPLLVIAERQGYREAYSLEKPVQMSEGGGFAGPTVESLRRQFTVVREVSPENYGEALVSGTMNKAFPSDNQVSEAELIRDVTGWIINQEETAGEEAEG